MGIYDDAKKMQKWAEKRGCKTKITFWIKKIRDFYQMKKEEIVDKEEYWEIVKDDGKEFIKWCKNKNKEV